MYKYFLDGKAMAGEERKAGRCVRQFAGPRTAAAAAAAASEGDNERGDRESERLSRTTSSFF